MPSARVWRRVATTGGLLGAAGIYYTFLTPTALLRQHLKSIRSAASDGVRMPPRSSVAFVGGQSIHALPPLHTFANMSQPVFILFCMARMVVLSVYLAGVLVGAAAAYVGAIDVDTFGSSLAWALQRLGPMYVKMGQWIATRPDLFPPTIYKHMEDLLETAPPHSGEATLEAMKAIPELADSISDLELEPINVGSIGQVHLCTLSKPFEDEATGVSLPVGTKLVVKVCHPNVRRDVAVDSAILCCGAYLAQYAVGSFLNARAAVDEFRALLLTQLDMRRERDNLIKLRFDFRNSAPVRIPLVLAHFSTEDVLVETFEFGESVRNVTAEYGVGGTGDARAVSSSNPFTSTIKATLNTLAVRGLDIMLRMIFETNFVHADLHSGNVLARFEQASIDSNGLITKSYASVKDGSMLGPETTRPAHLRLFGLEALWLKFHALFYPSSTLAHVNNAQLVILDAGLSSTLQKEDLECFVKLFACFTLQDASIGVQAMEERQMVFSHDAAGHNPNLEQGPSMDKEGFHKALEEIIKIHDPLAPIPVNMSLLFVHLLDAMRANKVRVDANFASLLSSVIVGEGLGRQLDPEIDVFQQVAPYLARHFSASQMTSMAGRIAEVKFIPKPLPSLTTAQATTTVR